MPGMNKRDFADRLELTYEDVDNLTIKELRFIGYICELGLNHPGLAYKKAGYKVANEAEARSKGKELMVKPEVHSAIDRFIKKTLAPFKDRILFKMMNVLEARAFWNVKDFFDETGKVKNLNQIPEEVIYAIDGVKEDYKGKDANRRVVSLDLADREKAFKLMMTYIEKGEAEMPEIPEESKKFVDSIMKAARKTTMTKTEKTEVEESIEVPKEHKNV